MEQVKGTCLSREKHLWAELSVKSKYFKSNTEDSESKYRLAVQAAREGICCVIHQRPTQASSDTLKVVNPEYIFIYIHHF